MFKGEENYIFVMKIIDYLIFFVIVNCIFFLKKIYLIIKKKSDCLI